MHFLFSLITKIGNIFLDVTKISNMFLFDFHYSNFAIVPFFTYRSGFLEKKCTKIKISEILVVKKLFRYLF